MLNALALKISSFVPFLPEYPYRHWVVLITFGSALVGFVVFSLFMLQAKAIEDPDSILSEADSMGKKKKFRKAKKLYLSVGLDAHAAQMAAYAGQRDEAILLAQRAQEYGLSGRLLKEGEKLEDAARDFDRARDFRSSAEVWEKAGQLDQALERYRKVGDRNAQIRILKNLGRTEDLVKLEQAHLTQMLQNIPSGSSEEGHFKKARTLAQDISAHLETLSKHTEASQVLLKVGLTREAAEMLEKAQRYVEAGDLYRQADDLERAADVFVKAGKHQVAADIYEELGRHDEIPKLLALSGRGDEAKIAKAKLLLGEGKKGEAAELFADSGQFTEAAELFQEVQNFVRAAQMWDRTDQLSRAAACYESAGEYALAAERFQSIQDLDHAAENFERAGDMAGLTRVLTEKKEFYRIARIIEQRDGHEAAIPYYQKVPANSPEYTKAQHALAKSFALAGMEDLAAEKYAILTKDKPLNRDVLDLFYDYACFLEKRDAPEEAKNIFENILSLDFQYKDVLARKKLLERRIAKSRKHDGDSTDRFQTVEMEGADRQPRTLAGRYEIREEIGRGAVGIVFHGYDETLDRDVAIKILSSKEVEAEKGRERFLRETRLIAKLHHKHIVNVYDAGEEQGSLYIILEYVAGQNLGQVLKKVKRIGISDALRIGIQVSDALSYAHEQKIVHRDIKSENLLVSEEKLVKVADFGLAKMLSEKKKTTTQVIGSPAYMAPEQIQGEAFDHRVDLYSLGVVLYELISGELPFQKGEIAYHHVHTEPTPLVDKREDCPESVSSIVMTLLKKNPEERIQAASELRELLRAEF